MRQVGPAPQRAAAEAARFRREGAGGGGVPRIGNPSPPHSRRPIMPPSARNSRASPRYSPQHPAAPAAALTGGEVPSLPSWRRSSSSAWSSWTTRKNAKEPFKRAPSKLENCPGGPFPHRTPLPRWRAGSGGLATTRSMAKKQGAPRRCRRVRRFSPCPAAPKLQAPGPTPSRGFTCAASPARTPGACGRPSRPRQVVCVRALLRVHTQRV